MNPVVISTAATETPSRSTRLITTVKPSSLIS